MFTALQNLPEKSQLGSLEGEEVKEWLKATKCKFWGDFYSSDNIGGAFIHHRRARSKRTRALITQAVKLDEEGIPMTRPAEVSLNFSAIRKIFSYWSVLLFPGSFSSSGLLMAREHCPSPMSFAGTREKVRAFLLSRVAPGRMASLKPKDDIHEGPPSSIRKLPFAAKKTFQMIQACF